MKSNIRDNILKFCTLMVVITVIVGGVVAAWPAYQRLNLLKLRDAELSECIEAKRLEIAALVENQRRFRTDPDFVEAIARQNRRVFPGELVFIFQN